MLLYSVSLVAAALLILAGAAWVVRWALRSSDETLPGHSVGLVAMAALVAVPIIVVLAFFFLPAPVAEQTLLHSIERETDSAGSSYGSSSECADRDGSDWRCEVYDVSTSNEVEYAVDAGTWCWDARRIGPREDSGLPARSTGCARLRDVLGLFD